MAGFLGGWTKKKHITVKTRIKEPKFFGFRLFIFWVCPLYLGRQFRLTLGGKKMATGIGARKLSPM